MRPTSLIAALLLGLCACDDDSVASDGGQTDAHRADLLLDEAGRPVPDGPAGGGQAEVGQACVTDQDCVEPPDATCFRTVGGGMASTIIFPNGYCSRACGGEDASSPDCGQGGGCTQVTLFGSGTVQMTFCAKGCKKNEDCRVSEGYTCRIILPGFPGFCAPK